MRVLRGGNVHDEKRTICLGNVIGGLEGREVIITFNRRARWLV